LFDTAWDNPNRSYKHHGADLSKEELKRFDEFAEQAAPVLKRYQAAMREMCVRFEILDDSLEDRNSRNPIHHIESRLKKPYSIFEKLGRYGVPQTVDAMVDKIFDIAGVRVIVSYLDDVYLLLGMLQRQDDLAIIQLKDYIKEPKPNGYRSLHFITRVPIYFQDDKELIPVEVQIRTIAMDFWASLEHDLRYKATDKSIADEEVADELRNCSDIIEDVERRMQQLMHALR
jgi:putative GTP pyrophosphokinase